MEFRILGSFEVLGTHGAIDLRGAKRRGLLAYLVVHAGQPVSVDRLVEELWGERGSKGAARTVQTYVSQLRKLLRGSEATLRTRPGGYVLEVDRADVDAYRFERAVAAVSAEPDPAGRLSTVDDALELWRGPPLSEFAGVGWADPEAVRLEALHLEALQHRYDALMDLDRAGETVAELEALASAHGLNERLWAQLMLALYRSGRQADALGAYQRARRHLVDELGIEPGPELAELEHRILNHDATLTGPTDRTASAAMRRGVARATAATWYPRTFLLTDIVASVSLWERDPEAMSQAVARHDTILQDAVSASGGELIRAKGEGDSTFSVFVHPSDALTAAAAIHEAVAAEPWPTATPLDVRTGVHTGDAEPRDGQWYGPAVNRAARLRALADGGRTLLSGVTAGLVADRMPEDARLLFRGRKALRGIERPEEVWELVTADDPRLVTTGDLPSRELPPALELLADASSFVGRTVERDRLRRLWQRARTGQWLVAVVTGEPGIGKSRLVAELAAEIHSDGGRVLLGSCFEDLGLPYEPFVQALKADMAGLANAEVRRRVGTHRRAMARLVPELVPILGGDDPGVAAGGVADRAEIYASLSDYLSRAAEGAPLLLVLEDLHWSTPTTRHALRHLARADRRAPILVVATTRDSPPELDQALAVLLGDMVRYPSVERVELGGLDEQDVGALVASLAAASERRTDIQPGMLHAETGGNPLLVRELVTVPTSAAGRRAGSVHGLLSLRYERLSDHDIALLDLAAVVGPEFDAELIAAAGDTGLVEVLETLERAESAGLVAVAPGRPGRFTFVHALFRSVRYEALPTSRRLRLHQQVVRVLQSQGDDERILPELARHACIAAPLGEARTAIDYSRRAGELARRMLASEEAAGHYRQALEMTELLNPPDPHLRLRLRIDLGAALFHGGHPDGRALMLSAADEARAQHQPDTLAAVAMLFHPAGVALTAGGYVDQEVVAVFEDALNAVPPGLSATRARLLAGQASELQASNLDQSRVLAREAIAIARALEDRDTLGRVLIPYRQLLHEPACADERRAINQELVELGRRLNEPVFTMNGLWHLCVLSREEGDLERAEEFYSEADAVFGDPPPPYARLFQVEYEATRQYLEGDLGGAEATAEQLLSVAPSAGFDPVNFYGLQLLFIRHQQGRIAELVPTLEQVVTSQPSHRGMPGSSPPHSPAPDGSTTQRPSLPTSPPTATTCPTTSTGSRERSPSPTPWSCLVIARVRPFCSGGLSHSPGASPITSSA
jgi:DNA-binding SARP family transcriptional activator/tetratricopeptide (TPR) repeat protein